MSSTPGCEPDPSDLAAELERRRAGTFVEKVAAGKSIK